MNRKHLSDHDLERYYLGMVTEEKELAPLEEHILGCAVCAERAAAAESYVDIMRAALLEVIEPIDLEVKMNLRGVRGRSPA